MNLTKDTYEYLLNFADDREVLNMLSVNKKFRDEEFFEKVMKRRYPLVIRFRKNENWRDFYIQTIYYLSKLKEEFKFPYIPTLDFDPKIIYRYFNYLKRPYTVENIKDMLKNQNKGYHTIAYLIDDKYVVDPNLRKGHSMTNLGFLDEPKDEIIIDLSVENPDKETWLAFISEKGSNLYSKLFVDREEVIKYLYELYLQIVNYFVDEIFDNLIDLTSREEIIQKDANLPLDWQGRIKFVEKIPEGITLKMDIDYPNKEFQRFDFQLLKVNL